MSASVNGFGEIAESLRRSTVLINAGGRGNGSGVIWSSEGVIITNAHVARRDRVKVEAWDGQTVDAIVEKRDTRRDLAMLRARQVAPAAQPGDSNALRAGQIVLAAELTQHGLEVGRAHDRAIMRLEDLA